MGVPGAGDVDHARVDDGRREPVLERQARGQPVATLADTRTQTGRAASTSGLARPDVDDGRQHRLPVVAERDAALEQQRLLAGAVEDERVPAAVERRADGRGPEPAERAVAAVGDHERRTGGAARVRAEEVAGQGVALEGDVGVHVPARGGGDEVVPGGAVLAERGQQHGVGVGHAVDERQRLVVELAGRQEQRGGGGRVACGAGVDGGGAQPVGLLVPGGVPARRIVVGAARQDFQDGADVGGAHGGVADGGAGDEVDVGTGEEGQDHRGLLQEAFWWRAAAVRFG